MRRNRTRPRSLSAVLGLVTTSLLLLCGGALLAALFEGPLRLVFGVAGFAGYVFLFARALRKIAFPEVLIEGRSGPDGEVRKALLSRKTGRAVNRNHVLMAAALAAVFTFVGSPSNSCSAPRENPPCSTPSSFS